MLEIDGALASRLYRRAGAERWEVAPGVFAEALKASAEKAFKGRAPARRDIEHYLDALHLEDLALACACASGKEAAWEHFIREHRPVLYRSADAMDPTGGARELADSLYADLYGLGERDGSRQSLFRYFHGRSSLATWLRAVLAQRHVDRLRAKRRLEPLPEEESPMALMAPAAPADPGRAQHFADLERGLAWALSRIGHKDRLRISCYYAQGMTLAEIGRLLHEHEATVSRSLARTRRALHADIVRYLRDEARLSDAQIAACFHAAAEDAGPMDLQALLVASAEGKDSAVDRSSIKRAK